MALGRRFGERVHPLDARAARDSRTNAGAFAVEAAFIGASNELGA
jgi:hypothetical protein